MVETIKHEGRVVSITGRTMNVRILQSSACSGCSAAKLCQSSEIKEKLVRVQVTSIQQYSVGDFVTIEGSIQQGLRATWWAYVLPLFVVVLVIALATWLCLEDALVALLGIGVLAVYYFILYAMRARFEKKFSFSVVE